MDSNGKVAYTTKSSSGTGPHSTAVASLSWNERVPAIYMSLDEAGMLVVWDTRRHSAVRSYNLGVAGIDCCFSPKVATLVYAAGADGMVRAYNL